MTFLKKKCSIKGCYKNHCGKGYCKHHLDRFNRYGDPLISDDKKHGVSFPHIDAFKKACEDGSVQKLLDQRYMVGSIGEMYNVSPASASKYINLYGLRIDKSSWVGKKKIESDQSEAEVALDVMSEARRIALTQPWVSGDNDECKTYYG